MVKTSDMFGCGVKVIYIVLKKLNINKKILHMIALTSIGFILSYFISKYICIMCLFLRPRQMTTRSRLKMSKKKQLSHSLVPL